MRIEITKTQFPLATLFLDAGESARIQRSSMVYHAPSVKLEAHLNGRGHGIGKIMSAVGRKMTSGESALMTTAIAKNSGFVAIAPNIPGDIKILECGVHHYNINDGMLLALSEGCDYTMHRQSILKGKLSGSGGAYVMQTRGNGQILVNSFGSIVRLHLDNNAITIDNDHVVAWDNTLDYSLHTEHGFFHGLGTGEGLVDTFTGTGDILIQSLNMTNFAESLTPFFNNN